MAWTKSFASATMSEEDVEIIIEAQKRFKICEDWESQARTYFEYDYKFANGDSNNMYQWDNWVIGDRQTTNRPCLTINKTQQHNLQIVNDGKQNKPGVNIRPVGDDASFEAAQVFQEVVRHIEYISNAENVYDNAATFQVNAGWGYWRVSVEPISDMSFDKEIYIRRIRDPRAVYLDPNINEVDGSDARFGFIFDDMPKDLYELEYPKFKDFGGATVFNEMAYGWIQKDTVRVAEYFRKTQKEDKLVYFRLPLTGQEIGPVKWSTLDQDAKDKFKEVKENKGDFRERDTISDDIMVYKIAGNKIIDRQPWLGKTVPIVRLIGSETVIDGIWDCKGHTRALLDPQRIYNINSPLALDTPLPTPYGWTTMGDVEAGDMLLDEKGRPVKVSGISPIFINRDCYKVTFDDGSSIVADADHLWTVDEREKIKTYNWTWPVKTITTKELTPNKHFIYATKPMELEEKEFLIHPYLLGAWLGDGDTANPRFTAGKNDVEEMRSIIAEFGYNPGPATPSNYGAFSFTVYGVRHLFSKLNLLGNKHIPAEYLRASKEQRLLLLRGLMDTDGCYSKQFNRCIFTNTNLELIESFIELIRSLGIRFTRQNVKATSRLFPSGETYECKPAVHISFTVDPWLQVFELFRKAEPQTEHRIVHEKRSKRHKIKSVEKIASVPVKCVAINSDSHLFLAGVGMIPTHNSANVEFGALQSKVPWSAPAAAIENLEEYWKTANTTNHSVLPWNHIDEDGNPIPEPKRPAPPQASPAYVEQMKIAQEEMMMVSGQYQAQMGENENAKSGVAINARQRQGDRATYHFIDNQAIAIRRTGKILIDLIPKVYDTQRVIRIEAKDGSIMNVTMDPNAEKPFEKQIDPNGQPDMDNQQQIVNVIFNPNVGTYDVQSDTGPSFATRRQEAFNALTQIAAQNKEFMNIGGDLLWKVADFPEAQELARRWRKIIPPNITGDAPNPQQEAMMHAAADKIEQQLALIAKQQKELDDKDRELTIKEREVAIKEGLAGNDAIKTAVEQIREDFDAMSRRITALGNSGPAFSAEQVAPLIAQAVAEALAQHGVTGVGDLPGLHQGGTPIGLPQGNSELPDSVEGVKGSRMAADGRHYIKNANGGYAEVQPIEASENA